MSSSFSALCEKVADLLDNRQELKRRRPTVTLARAYARFIEDMLPWAGNDAEWQAAAEPIISVCASLHDRLPDYLLTEGPFTTTVEPFIDEAFIEQCGWKFLQYELQVRDLYQDLMDRLERQGHKGAPVTIDQYFQETPLIHLLRAPTTVSLREPMTEHMVMIGQQGSGKTTVMGAQAREYLSLPDPPAMVFLDPHTRFVHELERLDYWRERKDQLVVVEPKAIPALNLLYTPRDLSKAATAHILSLYTYLFMAGDADLSSNMETMLTYAVQMLIKKHEKERNVTLHNFLDLFNWEPPSSGKGRDKITGTIKDHPDWKYMEACGPYAVKYWTQEYLGEGATAKALSRRFHAIAKDEAFCAMLDAQTNQLDLWKFLHEEKKTIVISGTGLGSERETFFRYMTLLLIQFAYSREPLNERDCHPVIVFIDEAHEVLTEHEADIFMNALRKFGIVLRTFTQQTSNYKSAAKKLLGQCRMILAAGDLASEDAGILSDAMKWKDSDFLNCPNPRDARGRPKVLNFTYWLSGNRPIRLQLEPRGPFPDWPPAPSEWYREQAATWRRILQDQPHQSSPPPTSTEEPHSTVHIEPEDFD